MDLSKAITPAKVVETLEARGIVISERSLRDKARRSGTCRIIGRAIFFMPEDIDALLESLRPQTPPYRQSKRRRTSTEGGSDLEIARQMLQEAKERRRKGAA